MLELNNVLIYSRAICSSKQSVQCSNTIFCLKNFWEDWGNDGIKWDLAFTFSENSTISRLAHREDRLDEDAHAALGRVYPSHHTEAETLLARALLKVDVVKSHGHGLGSGWDNSLPATHPSLNCRKFDKKFSHFFVILSSYFSPTFIEVGSQGEITVVPHHGCGGHTGSAAGPGVVTNVDNCLEAALFVRHPVSCVAIIVRHPVLWLALALGRAGDQGPEVHLLVINRRRPRPLNLRQPPPPPPLHWGRGGHHGPDVPGDDDVDVSVTIPEVGFRLIHGQAPETGAIDIDQLVTKMEPAVSETRKVKDILSVINTERGNVILRLAETRDLFTCEWGHQGQCAQSQSRWCSCFGSFSLK